MWRRWLRPRLLFWGHLLIAAGLAVHGHHTWALGRFLAQPETLAHGSLVMLLALAPTTAAVLLVAWPRAAFRLDLATALLLVLAAALLSWSALAVWVIPTLLLATLARGSPEDAGVR